MVPADQIASECAVGLLVSCLLVVNKGCFYCFGRPKRLYGGKRSAGRSENRRKCTCENALMVFGWCFAADQISQNAAKGLLAGIKMW